MFFPHRERRLVTRSYRQPDGYVSSVRLADSQLVASAAADAFKCSWAMLSVETAYTHEQLDARALHQGGDNHQYAPRVLWKKCQPL